MKCTFGVLGTNDFHVAAENENLPPRQNLKYDLKLSLCRLTEFVKKKIALKEVLHVYHGYFVFLHPIIALIRGVDASITVIVV